MRLWLVAEFEWQCFLFRFCATRLQHSVHCSAINSFRASRDEGATGFGSEPSNIFSVRNQLLIHVPGANDRQTADIQQRRISAAVKNRRRVFFEAGFETARVHKKLTRTARPVSQRLRAETVGHRGGGAKRSRLRLG